MSLHGSTNRAVVIEKATAVKNTAEDVNVEKVQEKKLVNDNIEGRFLGASVPKGKKTNWIQDRKSEK